MINTSFQLIDERKIYPRIYEQEIDLENQIVIRPKAIALCNADARYYFGKRPREILLKKLPLALGHEAIGTVVHDPKNVYKSGTPVVMIPNIATTIPSNYSANYDRNSKFCSSSKDGFMQELVIHDRNSILELPVKDDYVVEPILEFISIIFHSLSRFENIANENRETIGVWGDGNLGYICALVLNHLYPNSQIHVFGKHMDKLSRFSFIDNLHIVEDAPTNEFLDHAFECVGGIGSQFAINQIIDIIKPQGVISLMGVTEEKVDINTRMVLEKGITILGNSRSVKEDFERAINFISDKEVYDYLRNVIAEKVEVKTIEDIYEAFEIDSRTEFGKVVMDWKI